MSKKNKLNESGIVKIASLLPVGSVIGLNTDRKPDNFKFKGFPGEFDRNGRKINEETDFIAFWNRKQYPIKGKDLWDAKQKAIAQLKIPKSKQGLLAIKSKKSMDAGDFRFEGKIDEDFDPKYKKQAEKDFDNLSTIINMMYKISASAKKYSNSVYMKSKECRIKLEDLQDYLAEDTNITEEKHSISEASFTKQHFLSEGIVKETGEWDPNEGKDWLKYLENSMKKLQRMTKGKAKFEKARGFDMYQGPYAIVKINGKPYKVWTQEEDEFWIEDYPVDNTSKRGLRKGFQGDLDELAGVIS